MISPINYIRATNLNSTLEILSSKSDNFHILATGRQNLDRAAMKIVTMAAPFDPFPDFLRAEYDVLRFAYEWRFSDGYVSTTVKSLENR